MSGSLRLRAARPEDVDAIVAVDPVAAVDEERRRFIGAHVEAGQVFVAVARRSVVGYLVLEHGFFGRGFIAMLCVHPDRRRAGVGMALVRHAERACRSARIFTSTNRSNLPMQALLARLGYERSGVVDDLDPGDPELIYSRSLRAEPGDDARALPAAELRLLDVVRRAPHPEPWTEGDNIPWHDPAFSERMLREHLSQEHDAASRRSAKLDRHVAWIHGTLLSGAATQVLDLGCGPGLYAARLAALGHRCHGIDFSPASIRYAREQADAVGSACSYVLGDLRQVDFGRDHGLAMVLFGELNVFTPDDAQAILRKAHAALQPGGWLLLEPHTFEAVRGMGDEPASWSTGASGLFADAPHLVLTEHAWHEGRRAATIRHFVVEAATGEVQRHAQTMQAYTDAEYHALLAAAGFGDVAVHPSLTGRSEDAEPGLMVIAARAMGSGAA